MKEKKFKCSICGTVYGANLYNQKNIYNTIVMECPKDRGICWPCEKEDSGQLKSLLLKQYTKEELWLMLEKIRAKKATLEKNTFNDIERGMK